MSSIQKSHLTPQVRLSHKHHMTIHWKELIHNDNVVAVKARFKERASLVGRVGIIMLACGTGAWRVRSAMNTTARALGMTCSADIGLVTISFTCFGPERSYSQVLSLPTSGVNTDKLARMEQLVRQLPKLCQTKTIRELHIILDQIQHLSGNYTPPLAALAAALACSAFVFLLGGGLVEMCCCFVGAGIGNWVRKLMLDRHLTIIACIATSVALAGVAYLGCFKFLELVIGVSARHEAGYIGAMLFVIPGFPFITSMLDMAKLDMKSGLERLLYALMITTTAALVGLMVALLVHFKPDNFAPLQLSAELLFLLRLPASFCGVFGFSIMFNSPPKMAACAGLIGAVANTLRLELVDLTAMPPSAAAFIGALVAGLIASVVNRHTDHFPRVSLTVPAIVIMIPGLYIYRGIYNLGINAVGVGALWLSRAALTIMFLPLGLFVARVLLDKDWRHCN